MTKGKRTVDFYSNVLGMPLIKTLEIPGGPSTSFSIAATVTLWPSSGFPTPRPTPPGIAAAGRLPGVGDIVSAHGSMNHVAFDVPVDKFDEYVEKLQAQGVEVSPVLNHDNSRSTVAAEMNDEVFVRSVYFCDPDGILLEFACWTSPSVPTMWPTLRPMPRAFGSSRPVPDCYQHSAVEILRPWGGSVAAGVLGYGLRKI